VERELAPAWGVSVGYFYVGNKNFYANQNTLVSPSDYSSYCVTTPTGVSTPFGGGFALPGGGGSQICGLYDVSLAKQGQIATSTTIASAFGDYTDTFHGVDAAVRARFGHGGILQGGLSVGRSETNTCFANNRPDVLPAGQATTTPRTDAFCDVVGGWWQANGQIKLSGSYPLKYGLNVSGVYQNLAGPPILATNVFTNAQILPLLQRNLSACGTNPVCAGTVTVAMIPNLTMFEARVNQFDFRLGWSFKYKTLRATPAFDLYNLFNASPVLGRNNTYGPAWGTPTRFLDGRLAKFGVQIDF
jgi:hypothetical protein